MTRLAIFARVWVCLFGDEQTPSCLSRFGRWMMRGAEEFPRTDAQSSPVPVGSRTASGRRITIAGRSADVQASIGAAVMSELVNPATENLWRALFLPALVMGMRDQ